MSDPQLQPTPSRSLDDWTALIAAGALVAGGFLVSIAGPMLRKLYDARRDELDELRQNVTYWREVAGQSDDELAGVELGGRAADVEAAKAKRPDPHDVWSSAAARWSDEHPGVGAELDGADPAATVPDGS